jgi:hypothetical protein
MDCSRLRFGKESNSLVDLLGRGRQLMVKLAAIAISPVKTNRIERIAVINVVRIQQHLYDDVVRVCRCESEAIDTRSLGILATS